VTPAGLSLEVRGVSKAFARRGLPAVDVLRDLDLSVRAGEIVAIMGASGSGKSTLLHALGGMLAPDSGSVSLAGQDPWRLGKVARAAWRNSQVGFVFQSHRLLSELSALENVLVPAWMAGADGIAARREAVQLLDALGLAGRLHHHPSELSGGEAQRVAIARALSRAPRLVLADEPTGNLDREAGRKVFEEFVSLQRRREFVAIVATHDDELAERCDRILMLRDGRLLAVAGDASPVPSGTPQGA
jgi:lipoprotein-releasing system ATP-binding protein